MNPAIAPFLHHCRWDRLRAGFVLSLLAWAAGLLLLPCPSSHAEMPFQRTEIDAQPPRNPWIKIAGDLNHDGFDDIIIGGQSGPLVFYAFPKWSKSVIAEGGYDSVNGAVADVNNDGHLDVIIGGVLWYENPGPDHAASGPWKAHRIGKHRTHDLEAADLDGDGKIDVIVRGQTGFNHNEGHRILLYKQISPTGWQSREIACPPGEGLKVADLNRNGRPDIVIGGRWFENDGRILDGQWREHVFAADWKHGDTVTAVGDLTGNGRLDVVLSPAEGAYRLSWFEAPSDPRHDAWQEHVIDPATDHIHGVALADFDGDGHLDIAAAKMHQGNPPRAVTVYRNQGGGKSWETQILSTRGSHGIRAADIGNDGSPDIFGANHGSPYQPVELWKNQSSRTNAAPMRLIEDAVDPGVEGLACYKIITPTATYFLEKHGAGLSSLIDIEGHNWINFHPRPGSGSAGEWRGFPNAVYREAGNYFHARNSATEPSTITVDLVTPGRITLSAVSSNALWACRYDFFPAHCTFTMIRKPDGHKFWVLYEGTPGGEFDLTDWWMTSATPERQLMSVNHNSHIPAPSWIAFGDAKLDRVLFMLHHEEDSHPDYFYQMNGQMTVFGFGRSGLTKFLDSTPQHFSIGFIESTEHAAITREIDKALKRLPTGSGGR